ncbi:MAG TPA: hypothetical protein VIV60_17900 [Polyangiaceae bacterium]
MLAEAVYNRRSPKSVEILHCDSDVAVGGASNLFIVVWRDRTTAEGVKAVGSAFETFCSRYTAETALFTIVERGAKAPDPEAREPLALLMRAGGKQVVISAVVYEQTGFLAAAFRGVVTGLCIVARQTFPHRMFKDVEDAVRWIESERAPTGKCFRAADLLNTVASFRRIINLGKW